MYWVKGSMGIGYLSFVLQQLYYLLNLMSLPRIGSDVNFFVKFQLIGGSATVWLKSIAKGNGIGGRRSLSQITAARPVIFAIRRDNEQFTSLLLQISSGSRHTDVPHSVLLLLSDENGAKNE